MATTDGTGRRIYGAWAGHPQGYLEDVTRCIEGVWPNERGSMEHQCLNKRGHGPDGLYCRRHDPAVVQAKRDSRKSVETAKRDRDESIKREAKRIATALGVKAEAEYFMAARFRNCGYREALVVPFDEARALIARLRKMR